MFIINSTVALMECNVPTVILNEPKATEESKSYRMVKTLRFAQIDRRRKLRVPEVKAQLRVTN
jgi:hypothetical protein